LSEVQFVQRFLIPATQRLKREEVLRQWYIGKAKEKIIPRVKRQSAVHSKTHFRNKTMDVERCHCMPIKYWGYYDTILFGREEYER
jgi:hypothetical protein